MSPVPENGRLLVQGRYTADSAADINADPIPKLVGDIEPRVDQRLFRGDYAELNESIRAPREPVSDSCGRVEIGDLAGDLTRKTRRVEDRYPADSRLSRQKASPHSVHADAERRQSAHPGYGYIECQGRLSSPENRQRNGPDCRPAKNFAEPDSIELYQRRRSRPPGFTTVQAHILSCCQFARPLSIAAVSFRAAVRIREIFWADRP